MTWKGIASRSAMALDRLMGIDQTGLTDGRTDFDDLPTVIPIAVVLFQLQYSTKLGELVGYEANTS